MAESDGQQGGEDHLDKRTRDSDSTHRDQILDREMQPDPEHQQDDPDFRQLQGQALICHETWGERPNGNARQEISDQQRYFQTVRECPKDKSQAQSDHQDADEGCFVRHLQTSPLGGLKRAGLLKMGSIRSISTKMAGFLGGAVDDTWMV